MLLIIALLIAIVPFFIAWPSHNDAAHPRYRSRRRKRAIHADAQVLPSADDAVAMRPMPSGDGEADTQTFALRSGEIECLFIAQDPWLLVDDQGRVCSRAAQLANGCCGSNVTAQEAAPGALAATTAASTAAAGDCDELVHCCSSYESCVAACMSPEQSDLRRMLYDAATGHPQYRTGALAASPTSPSGTTSASNSGLGKQQRQWVLQLCAARCRLAAGSVAHENRYRNAGSGQHHCFGLHRPLLSPAMRHPRGADEPPHAKTDKAAAGAKPGTPFSLGADGYHDIVGYEPHLQSLGVHIGAHNDAMEQALVELRHAILTRERQWEKEESERGEEEEVPALRTVEEVEAAWYGIAAEVDDDW